MTGAHYAKNKNSRFDILSVSYFLRAMAVKHQLLLGCWDAQQ
jgi:hypothetical protein